VVQIGGEKHNHREGLHQCKPCRKQFSVTVGTPLERLRVPLSAWVRAAREFSADDTRRAYNARRKDNLVPLGEMASEIGVAYRTVLRMRDIIKRAARKYRGHKKGFGAGLWCARGLPIGKRAGTASIGPLGASAEAPSRHPEADTAQTPRLFL